MPILYGILTPYKCKIGMETHKITLKYLYFGYTRGHFSIFENVEFHWSEALLSIGVLIKKSQQMSTGSRTF